MTRWACSTLLTIVLLVSCTRGLVDAGQEHNAQALPDEKAEKNLRNNHIAQEKTRGLRQLQQSGFLTGRFPVLPVQRHRKKSTNTYYRQGEGKGKGKGYAGSNSKSGKGDGKGKGKGGYPPVYGDVVYFDDDLIYLDDNLALLDDDFVVTPEYDIRFCLPYPYGRHIDSSSSSDSHDSFLRHRALRLHNTNRELKGSKSKSGGKGSGGKGSGGKGSGGKGFGGKGYGYDDDVYGRGDSHGNGFGYGYEYGPDGCLRPRCPPGYVYYDQLPDADRPNRPGLLDDDEEDTLFPSDGPTTTPGTPTAPATPATPGPATASPATPGPATASPVTPGPATVAPAPAPATTAPTASPTTAGPVATPATDAPAGTPTVAPAATPTAAPAATPTVAPAATPTVAPASTTGGPTSAGSAAEEESGRVVVEDSFLEYGFFEEFEVREPTQEELDGLYEQTNRFFTDVFRAMFGDDFVAFTAENNVYSFLGADAEYPVNIDFSAVTEFAEGVEPPTVDEVFTIMQNADLNSFISDYVWMTTPPMSGMFFETQRVRYDARVQGRLRRKR
jgi:hypothetical protein